MNARRILPVLLIGLAIVGLFRLRIDVDILNLLPSTSPAARGLAVYQKNFLHAGELIIVVRSAEAETTLGAATSIVQQVRLHTNMVERAFWQAPANESLDDAAKFVGYLWLNGPTNAVADLKSRLNDENLDSLLGASRERIATSFSPSDLFLLPRDPLDLASISSAAGDTFETPDRFFSSADGLTRLVYVYSAIPLTDYRQCRDWVREIRELISRTLSAAGYSKVEILLTGRPVFADEISAGMQADMSTAVPGTLLLIGLLFYLLHREWISLILLLTTLFGIMIWTALAGSAIIGQLNVVSVGFASILLGLAEDFGIVLHQEAKNHPGLDAAGVRKVAGPGIFWSALTTASAFALLNLSALPGLRDLGTLVALGIVIGAWAMLYLFLPLLLLFPRGASAFNESGFRTREVIWRRQGLAITSAVLLIGIVLFIVRPPVMDPSPESLRPRKSEAHAALRVVQDTIGTSGDPFWLLVRGKSEEEVRRKLEVLNTHLQTNEAQVGVQNFNLPVSIWPDPTSQRVNLATLKVIARDQERIDSAVLTNGFTQEALAFSSTVFKEWQTFSPDGVNWPRGRIAEWVLPKFVARTGTNVIALGLITPGADLRPSEIVPDRLKNDVLFFGWSLLGKEVMEQVKREMPFITLLVGLTVLCALWLTFRKIGPVLQSLAVLGFSAIVLMSTMGVLGWRWNLISLTALPLLLGMGIDYSIHIQIAQERFHGDAARTFHSVGRALLLAGSTTIIGFAFLGMSSNAGMASLGRVCALGLTILLLTSVFLLPTWTRRYQT